MTCCARTAKSFLLMGLVSGQGFLGVEMRGKGELSVFQQDAFEAEALCLACTDTFASKDGILCRIKLSVVTQYNRR